MTRVQSRGRAGRALAAPVALLLTAAPLTACGDDAASGPAAGSGITQQSPQPEAATPRVLPEEQGDPDDLVGQELTVTGTVQQTLAPGAFVLVRTDTATSFEPLLVVAADSPDVQQDQSVRATGTVVRFDADDVASGAGVALDAEALRELEGSLYLVADSVETLGTVD